jgi:hypothetical protein
MTSKRSLSKTIEHTVHPLLPQSPFSKSQAIAQKFSRIRGRSILLVIAFSFLTGNCTFVSKRIESRERLESEKKSPSDPVESDDQLTQIQVRDQERRLKSHKERELYSKLLPWFRNEKERLEFLSIPSLSEKQSWAQEKRIWSRAKNPNEEMRGLIQSQDIAIGMPMDYVVRSWGDPIFREVSGNPLFKNERWRYVRSVSTPDGFRQEKRSVYFEGGKVVGWETE